LNLNKNRLNLILYNIFLKAYSLALHLAALWNPKAKLWVKGRNQWKMKVAGWQLAAGKHDRGNDEPLDHEADPGIRNTATETPGLQPINASSKTIWMHCASLGEFEQGRPLLEAVKAAYPGHEMVVTFFSPSGYEVRKNYKGAALVMYLPMDGPANARFFINAINPSLVLWVKYEYWFYYLHELKQKNIPVLLISGIFRKSQPFFKWYGGLWKKMLDSFNHFFVQTENSQQLLQAIGITRPVTVTGDTRFDRVIAIAEQWQTPAEILEQFCGEQPVLVAGSTWEEDEELLIHYAKAYPKIKFILAPHEVSKERVEELKKEFPQALLYSLLQNSPPAAIINSNVLIIDNIGMLSRLYKYATLTYVGGGFHPSGIHNILEAAVYGKPVIFGPVYEKFAEAIALLEAGGAYSIENALELEALLNKLFNDAAILEKSSLAAKEFVYSHKGATQKIMEHIQKNRLLTN
jgi:3-deoxy-D-manno-octulosonic-acid transferase